MAKITVAKHAGFCFGVKRATDHLEESIRNARPGERIYTLGHLIHNEAYNLAMEKRGVFAIEADAIPALCDGASEEHPVSVLVRAHGCPRDTVRLLEELEEKNPHFRWIDCTCPYVEKIHEIAANTDPDEQFFVLIGAANHPEVVGIMSCFDGEKYVFSSPEELESSLSQQAVDKLNKKTPVMVAQTTQNLVNWYQSQKKNKKPIYKCENF